MPTKDGELNVTEIGKMYEMFTDVKYIRMALEESNANYKKLYEQINGNGKPGMRQDIHDLKNWKKENSEDLERIIRINSNKSYIKSGIWEAVRWIGSGTLIAIYLNLFKD